MDEIQKHRFAVLDHAAERGWVINPSKGMELFVETFLKLGHCPCDDKRPVCPCPGAEAEIKDTGKCRCGLYWASLEAFRKTLRPIKEERERSTSKKTRHANRGGAEKSDRPGTADETT